jgi:hypothetical protein
MIYDIFLESHVTSYVKARTDGVFSVGLDTELGKLPYILAQTPMISLSFGGMPQTAVKLESKMEVYIEHRHYTRVKRLYNYVECAMLNAYFDQFMKWEWVQYAHASTVVERAMNQFRDKYHISDTEMTNDNMWKILYRAKDYALQQTMLHV